MPKEKTYGWCKNCGSLVVGNKEHLCDKCGGNKTIFDVEFELVKLKQLQAEIKGLKETNKELRKELQKSAGRLLDYMEKGHL